MNANLIGNHLTQLIKTVIKEPVFISGNSSGGVLTAWLAANEPDWVKAIILEDPALLSSECPRLYSTIADKSFSMCSEFLCQGDQDFLLYWIGQCRDFFKKYVGFDISPILTASIQHYRKYNPDKPVEIFFLPSIVRLMIRGMSCYDPHFGAAFHENTWNAGFDHAETLTRIQCPALLLHAKTEIMEDGTLNGAMSQEEADCIVTLIPNCKYLKVSHFLKPCETIRPRSIIVICFHNWTPILIQWVSRLVSGFFLQKSVFTRVSLSFLTITGSTVTVSGSPWSRFHFAPHHLTKSL